MQKHILIFLKQEEKAVVSNILCGLDFHFIHYQPWKGKKQKNICLAPAQLSSDRF